MTPPPCPPLAAEIGERYQLLLASASPRRQSLLAQAGFRFEVPPLAEVDETPAPGDTPLQVPVTLARRKAQAYVGALTDRQLLITCDTVVVSADGRALGKPRDRAEALRHLQSLAGARHTVVTGCCLATARRAESFAATTDVWMAPLPLRDLEHYVDHYRPYDKAGAYGIQEWIGLVGVSRVEGSYHNVMGMPIQRICQELRKFI